MLSGYYPLKITSLGLNQVTRRIFGIVYMKQLAKGACLAAWFRRENYLNNALFAKVAQPDLPVAFYGGPGGRATKHCTTSGFLIEQYSDGPIPCSSNGAAVRFCDQSHSAVKRSSTSATALTSIDLFLGSNNGLYLGSNNGLFLRSNSGPFLRPTSQTYYGIYRWYLAWRHVILYYYSIYNSTWGEQYGSQRRPNSRP